MGVVNDENTELKLFASKNSEAQEQEAAKNGSAIVRTPGAQGKETEIYNREYSLFTDKEDGNKTKLLYKCALKSNTMPEAWEHLECVLEKIDC